MIGLLIFKNATMTLMQETGEIRAQDLDCQLDVVNKPWNMEVGGTIPTDWYDLFSIGWIRPVPERSDYFVNQDTGETYSVFGNPAVYFDHLEVRVSRYSGVTP